MLTVAVAVLLSAVAAPIRVSAMQATPTVRREPDRPAAQRASGVSAEMRNVDFHIDTGIVLHITRLRGVLQSTSLGATATLDDKASFALVMHTAQIAIDTVSLSTLLNRHVFGYKGSPIKKLHVHVEGDQLVQTGTLHKGVDLPFRIRARVQLTPDGRIRLHPTSVRILGMGVTNAMGFFKLRLSSVISVRPGHGVSLEGDDFILDPLAILPLPRIHGRLTGITLTPGSIDQTFGASPGEDVRPLRSADASTPNFMYFRHGTLRFGKLTMADADLLIVDADPKNVFDFSLDRYNDQLVAGYSQSTTGLGLVVHMPDFFTLGVSKRSTVPKARSTPTGK